MSPSQDVKQDRHGLPAYFDMQAKIGHTKHVGGMLATRQLMDRCDVNASHKMLYVGCGAGMAVIYIAQEYGCRVVGIDLKQSMVEAARKTAKRRGFADQIEFRQADAQNLPFENEQFDVVICESVNIFVPDRKKALSEYQRVLKPGGIVGINEAVWGKEPSEAIARILEEYVGHDLEMPEYWENLFIQSGLVDVSAMSVMLPMREESKSQMSFFKLGDYFRLFFKSIGVILGSSYYRAAIKDTASTPPKEFVDYLGYGLFTGRKKAY